MSFNPNWKNEPFTNFSEWMDQCYNSFVVREGDKLNFATHDTCIGCSIVSDNKDREVFVTVGYFFPNGLPSDSINPNCGWTH